MLRIIALVVAVALGIGAYFVGKRYFVTTYNATPQELATTYLKAVEKGDGARLQALSSDGNAIGVIGGVKNTNLLATEVYSATPQRPQKTSVDAVSVNGQQAMIEVSYTQAGKWHKATLKARQKTNEDGNRWYITEGLIGTLIISARTEAIMSVNGVNVSVTDNENFTVFPGTYEVSPPPAGEYLSYAGKGAVKVEADGEETVSYSENATDEAKKKAVALAKGRLAQCVKVHAGDKSGGASKKNVENCPLGLRDEYSSWHSSLKKREIIEQPEYAVNFNGSRGTVTVKGGRVKNTYGSSLLTIFGKGETIREEALLQEPWKIQVKVTESGVTLQ